MALFAQNEKLVKKAAVEIRKQQSNKTDVKKESVIDNKGMTKKWPTVVKKRWKATSDEDEPLVSVKRRKA